MQWSRFHCYSFAQMSANEETRVEKVKYLKPDTELVRGEVKIWNQAIWLPRLYVIPTRQMHVSMRTHTGENNLFPSKEPWCVGVSEAQIHLIFPALNTLSASKSSAQKMQHSPRSVTEESQGGFLWGKGMTLKNVSWPPSASLCFTNMKPHMDGALHGVPDIREASDLGAVHPLSPQIQPPAPDS